MQGVRLLSAVIASGAILAAADAHATTTVFTDLTNGRALTQTEAVSNPAQPGRGFVDLSAQTGPTVSPVPASVRSDPRSEFIDLTALRADPRPLAQIRSERKEEPPAPHVIGSDPDDPYESWNRTRYTGHLALYRNIVEPVGRTYIGIVPAPLRRGLHNVLTNLESPVIVVNRFLQGRVPQGMGAVARFAVNSTIGIAGIFDVATDWGLPFVDSDFGATLASYGVSEHPFFMIPALGPTNPRDLTGRVVDIFLNPLRFVDVPGGIYVSIAETGARELDKRTERLGELEEIEATAADPYVTYRQRALERRRAEIGETPSYYAGWDSTR